MIHYIDFVLLASLIKSYRVHLYKDYKWYISVKKSDQLKDINVKTYVSLMDYMRGACCITVLNFVHLNSGYHEYIPVPYSIGLFRCTVLVKKGS
jgi:hypothetical protein